MPDSRVVTTSVTLYRSKIHPEIETASEADCTIIDWADTHPVAWRIVREKKSKCFGAAATEYPAFDRGDSAQAVLGRLRRFMGYAQREDSPGFDHWLAAFALRHYGKTGYKSALFIQFDGIYRRGCHYVDYLDTPEWRAYAVRRFVAWCRATAPFPTRSVIIDKFAIEGAWLEEILRPKKEKR